MQVSTVGCFLTLLLNVVIVRFQMDYKDDSFHALCCAVSLCELSALSLWFFPFRTNCWRKQLSTKERQVVLNFANFYFLFLTFMHGTGSVCLSLMWMIVAVKSCYLVHICVVNRRNCRNSMIYNNDSMSL